MIDFNKYYTVKQAIDLTNWKRPTIHSLCEKGWLEYTIDDYNYRYILKRSLHRWIYWMNEYKPIPGFSNYTISKQGDIRKIRGRLAPMEISVKKDKDGYLETALRSDEGKRCFLRVHRLVAITYLPNPNLFTKP